MCEHEKYCHFAAIWQVFLHICVFAVWILWDRKCEYGFFQITHAKNLSNHSPWTRDLTRFFGICDLKKLILTHISSSQYSLISFHLPADFFRDCLGIYQLLINWHVSIKKYKMDWIISEVVHYIFLILWNIVYIIDSWMSCRNINAWKCSSRNNPNHCVMCMYTRANEMEICCNSDKWGKIKVLICSFYINPGPPYLLI
jgi:hypothetical protein